MRIPWYIVTTLILGVIGLGGWLAIRNADFTTAPSEEKIAKSVESWEESYPELPEKPKVTQRKQINIRTFESPVVKLPPPPKIPVGTLGFSPDLNHFTEHSKFGAASFIQLARRLEQNPELKRFSQLAWERAIDTGTPDPKQMKVAEEQLLALRQNEAAWWADSSQSLLLDLHISVPKESIADQAATESEILNTLREASSYLVIPSVVWRHDSDTPQVWLKAPTKSGSISHKTAIQIPINIDASKPGEAIATPTLSTADIYSAIFTSIQTTLRFSASPNPPQHSTLSARDALSTALTRLHWQAFTHLLHNIPQSPLKEAP